APVFLGGTRIPALPWRMKSGPGPAKATVGRPGPDFILQGRAGIRVPPRNTGALAEELTRLLADPVLRAGIARRGKKRAEDAFSDEAVLPRYEDLFRGLVSTP
ncbi:MAG: hypothetical protein R6W82_12335, partial [bacterium]